MERADSGHGSSRHQGVLPRRIRLGRVSYLSQNHLKSGFAGTLSLPGSGNLPEVRRANHHLAKRPSYECARVSLVARGKCLTAALGNPFRSPYSSCSRAAPFLLPRPRYRRLCHGGVLRSFQWKPPHAWSSYGFPPGSRAHDDQALDSPGGRQFAEAEAQVSYLQAFRGPLQSKIRFVALSDGMVTRLFSEGSGFRRCPGSGRLRVSRVSATPPNPACRPKPPSL